MPAPLKDSSGNSEELRETARKLREEEGKSFAEIAEMLGIQEPTLRNWSKRGNWSVPKVIHHAIHQRVVVKKNMPALEAALNTLYQQDTQTKEKLFDEHLHDIACSVPFIIKHLTAEELVTKADKVSKLVEMARTVLGKGESKQSKAAISLGILSGGPVHFHTSEPSSPANQALTMPEHTG